MADLGTPVLTRLRGAIAARDAAGGADPARAKRRARARASLLRQTLRWHWISAAVCLAGLLLFTVTGVTLNHAADLKSAPQVTERKAVLPVAERAALVAAKAAKAPAPPSTRAWLNATLGVKTPAGAAIEWTDTEAYVALPAPGANAWVTLDTESGAVVYERTDRGWIAYLNDLHKGRDTGPAWRWFIDVFAAGCVVFCVTGFILLQIHAHARASTWPLVGVGLLVPLLLAFFFIH